MRHPATRLSAGALALGLFAGGLAIGSPALAEGKTGVPHCGTDTGDTGTKAWTSYSELQKELTKLERQSKGAMKLFTIGESNQGRSIKAARVGTGPKVILVQSEIHGNEKTGTVALLNLLKTLTSNTPKAQKLREQVTVVAVPMMNPDASELDRRANERTWEEVVADFPQLKNAKSPWNYYQKEVQGDDYATKPGFDVNRDFNPNLDYVPRAEDFPGTSTDSGWYIHPESQSIRDLYKSLKGEFGNVDTFVDLHHQGPCYEAGDTGKQVTLSLSGKFVEIDNHSDYAENYRIDYSKQLVLAAEDSLNNRGNSPFGTISLYDQNIDLPGTALGSFALNGSGTVLFEVRGQTQSWGAKKKGQLVKAVETGLTGIVHSVADGSVESYEPKDYDDIPETTYPKN